MENFKSRKGVTQSKIWELLQCNGMMTSEIISAIPDKTGRQVMASLARMRDAGHIGRDDRGVWQVGIEDSGKKSVPIKSDTKLLIMNILKGEPATAKRIVFLSGLSDSKVKRQLYSMRRQGLVARNESGKWELGLKHDGTAIAMKKVLSMLEEGIYTIEEIQKEIGTDRQRASQLISRIRREYGISVKKVYVLG